MVVYREVFQTILFFIASWSEGSGLAVMAGGVGAVALLTVVLASKAVAVGGGRARVECSAPLVPPRSQQW